VQQNERISISKTQSPTKVLMTSNLNSLHRRRQLCNEKPDSQSSSAGKLIMQKIPKWTKSIKSFSFAGKRTKKTNRFVDKTRRKKRKLHPESRRLE
jgi:hypothetical protein